MRVIRALSAAAAGAALALTVAACTGSTTTIIEKTGAGGSGPAGRSASPSARPSPAGPVVTITPGNGASGANPWPGITVTAAGGTLKNVAVSTAGDPVAGTYSAGRASWHSTWALNVAQSYTVTATAVSNGGGTSAGVTTTKTSTFRTLTPPATFSTQIFEGYRQSYGVGMPIILSFSAPVQDKAAVERSIELQTSRPVIGAWYWDGNQTLDFRPRDYWPAHTVVSFTGHFDGIEAAPGVYGYHTLTQTFGIGDSVIAVASTTTHKTQVYVNGHLKYDWNISSGKPGDATPDDLAPANAETYYKLAVPGDPVTIRGSPRSGEWDNGWTEWFLSWPQYLKGSATGEAVVANASGSEFVNPSALPTDTAKAPLQTSAPENAIA
jgi:hypothetical protein